MKLGRTSSNATAEPFDSFKKNPMYPKKHIVYPQFSVNKIPASGKMKHPKNKASLKKTQSACKFNYCAGLKPSKGVFKAISN